LQKEKLKKPFASRAGNSGEVSKEKSHAKQEDGCAA